MDLAEIEASIWLLLHQFLLVMFSDASLLILLFTSK